jgi:malate dehydrogenase (oxaloacetate-decarboxylating)
MYKEKALAISKEHGGKIEVNSKIPIETMEDLSIAYTPGVAEVSREIHKDTKKTYEYTSKKNLVAIVTDGSAVLGLGNIGPEAAIPVMEGKALLFKRFANVDAVPIALNTQDTEEIIKTVENLAPSFGGINLEDISAPRCFEIERRLSESLDIPVFHDDQYGTAIVVLAATYNALKLADKNLKDSTIVVNGGGAAGMAIIKLFRKAGAEDIILVDSFGIVSENNPDLQERHKEIADVTNKRKLSGNLQNALVNADIFIGASVPNALNKDWIQFMNEKPIIFAMANPDPEILPDEAKKGGAYIVGTGRSDFPNQINNVLAFPGVFRGALDMRVSKITTDMMITAAKGLADAVPDDKLSTEYIIPEVFHPGLSEIVAQSIREI